MLKSVTILTVISLFMLNENVNAKPQDVKDAAIMAFAQVKDTFDNGAAAKDTKEFEFMGAKVKNDMAVGFGDAMRAKRDNSDSSSSEEERRKRSAEFENSLEKDIVNSNEKFLFKRSTSENETNAIDDDDSYYYDSSSSSSSSSASESDEESPAQPEAPAK